jgi:hypothetical protein
MYGVLLAMCVPRMMTVVALDLLNSLLACRLCLLLPHEQVWYGWMAGCS